MRDHNGIICQVLKNKISLEVHRNIEGMTNIYHKIKLIGIMKVFCNQEPHEMSLGPCRRPSIKKLKKVSSHMENPRTQNHFNTSYF